MAVFGLAWLGRLEGKAGNLRVGALVPDLPSVQLGMCSRRAEEAEARTEGVHRSTAVATERRPYTIMGSTAEARITATGVPFAPLAVRFDETRQAYFRGLTANHYGAGIAVFATHALWSHWPLDDALSQALHGDLFARRARYVLRQPALLQEQLHFSAGEDDVLLLNRGRQPVTAELMACAAEGQAYRGAIAQFTAAPTESGLPPGTARLTALVPGREIVRLRREPLLVQPLAGEVMVDLTEYGAEGIEFTIGGADAQVRPRRNRALEVAATVPNEVHMVLRDGTYAVRSRSRHVVTLTWRGGREETTMTATDDGELDLSGTYRLDTLAIHPLR
jgi:hypothetical protein